MDALTAFGLFAVTAMKKPRQPRAPISDRDPRCATRESFGVAQASSSDVVDDLICGVVARFGQDALPLQLQQGVCLRQSDTLSVKFPEGGPTMVPPLPLARLVL